MAAPPFDQSKAGAPGHGHPPTLAGFAPLGAAILVPAFEPTAALHALTAGAMGTMTLAIMSRATLGHSGRALTAGPGTSASYALIGAAALLRVPAPFSPRGCPRSCSGSRASPGLAPAACS